MKIYKGVGQPYKDGTTIVDVDVASRKLVSYFSSFGFKDSDGDIIQKGAYTKTIQEQGPKSKFPRTKWLIDHDRKRPFCFTDDLVEDNFGLKGYGTAGTHDDAIDFLKKVDAGLITEHSVYIVPVKQGFQKSLEANLITECQFWEGSSLHCWGANPHTPFAQKSLDDISTLYAKIKKALTTGTYTDKAMLEFQEVYDQLGALLKSAQQPDPEDQGTTDDEELSQTQQINLINIFKTAVFNGI